MGMFNDASLDAVARSGFGPARILPLYSSYCFARIPATIAAVLSGSDPSHALPASCVHGTLQPAGQVVLFLIDGLGWNRVEARMGTGLPGLAEFEERGVVSVLTSQFPSTTVVHTVTLYSGLPPGQAGVLEWYYREPRVGSVIAPFLMGHAGGPAGGLKKEGWTARDIFPEPAFIKTLVAAGVTCRLYTNAAFTPSDFSDRMAGGADVVATPSPEGAVDMAARAVAAGTKPAYHFVYLDSHDTVAHRYGPSSQEADREADKLLALIGRFVESAPAGTLVLVTADHGQVDVRPEDTVYLDRLWPDMDKLIARGADGGPLIPAGGMGRSLFIHALPGTEDELKGRLAAMLSGRADVFAFDELAGAGAYGPGPLLPDLKSRAGDLVVLPRAGESVWWHGGRFTLANRGNHGGMSADEMRIPFLSLRI